MATTGKINGTDLLVYVGGVAITHSTSCSVSLNMGTRGATTKDSKGWDEKLTSVRNWTMSAEGMVALDATYGLSQLWALANGRTKATLKFATATSGDLYFTGDAYMTSVEESAGLEDTATFSVSFEGTGRLRFLAT